MRRGLPSDGHFVAFCRRLQGHRLVQGGRPLRQGPRRASGVDSTNACLRSSLLLESVQLSAGHGLNPVCAAVKPVSGLKGCATVVVEPATGLPVSPYTPYASIGAVSAARV